MAWSLATIVPELDLIFAQEEKKYRIQHPNALSPRIFIQHEGNIEKKVINTIVGLFPEGVYVDFFPNVTFSDSGQQVEVVRKPTIVKIGRSPEKLRDTSSAFSSVPRKKEKKVIRVK